MQVISQLESRFGISRRQAYRYVQEAAKAKEMLPLPEEKIVFTVKLPVSLVVRLRKFAKSSGESISDVTARALQDVFPEASRSQLSCAGKSVIEENCDIKPP